MKYTLFLVLVLSSMYSISCKEKENPCETVICQNGGECDDEGNCICPPEFTGVNCELLANPKEIKIKKITLTDFLATNGLSEWDTSDGPDLYLTMVTGSISGGMILEQTNTIENCEQGTEYEFIVDWSMEGSELAYNFDLRDNDSTNTESLYDFMGSNHIYPMDYRADKPTVIDLPTLSGGFVGLRLEVEWIFE